MQTAADLDLSYLPIEEASFARDPFSHFAAARERHPWLARCSVGYMLTDWAAIRELMSHEKQMVMGMVGVTEIMGARHTPWGEFIADCIQSQHGALHARMRQAVAAAFTPRQADAWRPVIREVMADLLDRWAPLQVFDFEDFAAQFPITVMCRMLGASPTVIPHILDAMEALGLALSMQRQYLPKLQAGTVLLFDFVRGHVAARRAGQRPGPAPDLLDLLLQAREEGTLSEAELENLLVFVFAAGYDTSKNVLTLIMHQMIDRPDDYRRCAEDKAFCRRVLDETLRFHSVSMATRILREDIVIRDTLLPSGTMVAIPWSVSGRCPGVVTDPDVFDASRPGGSPHMGFGRGPKMCLGQFFARAQIEEGLHLMAQRIREPRRLGEPGWRPFPGVWGIHGLPIAFRAA
jgi:cytochrome P450